MSARARVAGVAAVSVLLMAGLVWAAQGRTLKVTVNYTGSGEVSATNAVYVTVWDTPDMQGGALPVGAQILTENGDTVSFENLSASPVYVSALYDEQGGWDVFSAAPSGSPAAADIELADRDAVERVLKRLADRGYPMRAMIRGVVTSDPFRRQ